MNAKDLPLLADRINALRDSKGRPRMSKAEIEEWHRLLAPYSWALVNGAIDEHRRINPHVPEPSDIIAAIRSVDGHAGPEEAWPIALKAEDEWESVIVTGEILEALAAAKPLIYGGDLVAARKTFLEAYARILAEVRREGRPAKWELELGWDKDKRAPAIEEAARRGIIGQEQATMLLPHDERPALPEMRNVLRLVAAPKDKNPEAARKALDEAMAALKRAVK